MQAPQSPGVAADLRPGQAEVVAQDVGEPADRIAVDARTARAVDRRDRRPRRRSRRHASSATRAAHEHERRLAAVGRGRRGRRRWARGPRGRRPSIAARASAPAPPASRASSRGQPLGDLRAGADDDPGRGDASVASTLDDRRDHGDRDDEVRPDAELEERGAAPRGAGVRDEDAVTSSSARRRSADCPHEHRRRGTTRRPGAEAAPPARRAPADSAGRRRPATRCRGCPRRSRGSGSGRPPIARAAALRPSNAGGRSARTRSVQVASARIRHDAIDNRRSRAAPAMRGDVEDVVRRAAARRARDRGRSPPARSVRGPAVGERRRARRRGGPVAGTVPMRAPG